MRQATKIKGTEVEAEEAAGIDLFGLVSTCVNEARTIALSYQFPLMGFSAPVRRVSVFCLIFTPWW